MFPLLLQLSQAGSCIDGSCDALLGAFSVQGSLSEIGSGT